MMFTRSTALGMCALFTMVLSGCDSLRFAPGEVQKQNAYLHYKTVEAAAIKSQQASSPPAVQELTRQAALQSEAIMAHYGLPKIIPPSSTIDELLSEENSTITTQAQQAASDRPDPWGVADGLMETGIVLAGLLGGVFGTRTVSAITLARRKTKALKEIVVGNERFKRESFNAVDDFKAAHENQSPATKELVASIKSTV